MCDYSLYLLPNRPARDGEELVAYRFPSGCTGFAGVPEIEGRESRKGWLGTNWPQLKSWLLPRLRHCGPTAVCVPPGTRLRLEPVGSGLRRQLGLAESEDAVFMKVAAGGFTPRDGLRFRGGRQILLQGLTPGQRIRIQSTAGEIRSQSEIETEEAYV